MSEYLTTTDVATMLRTSAETVRYWRHVGKGPKSFKVGRRVLYAREDVERFIAEGRARGHEVAQIDPPHVRLGRPAPKRYEEPSATEPPIVACPHCGGALGLVAR